MSNVSPEYKTFQDLVFERHRIATDSLPDYKDAKQAILDFDNGYGISVIIGRCFYSNGIDTYEVAVMKGDSICYSTPITDDVMGRLTAEQVTEIMKQIQDIQ